jgi:hypothetical protein
MRGEKFEQYQEPNGGENEMLDFGWQGRVAAVIDSSGLMRQEIQNFRSVLEGAATYSNGIAVVQGSLRDSILFAVAAQENTEYSRPNARISFATPSADNAIMAAYGISAVTNPENPLGRSVGYSVAQGKTTGGETKIVSSTSGSLSKLIREGRLDILNNSAIIVDGADSESEFNISLIADLKKSLEGQEVSKGPTPLVVLVARQAKRAEQLAGFLGVEVDGRTFYGNREIGDLEIPDDIRYEDNRRIDTVGRTVEILGNILSGDIHDKANVIVFVKRADDIQPILRELKKNAGGGWPSPQKKSDGTRVQNHMVYELSGKTPTGKKMEIQLDDEHERLSRQYMPKIVLSALPADLPEVGEKFDVVIDCFSRQGSSGVIDSGEALRRAAYAKKDGTCYRLINQKDADMASSGDEFDNFGRTLERIVKGDSSGDGNRNIETKEGFEKILDVEPHIARLVESLEKQDRLPLGLAIAACTRESRVLNKDSSSFDVNDKYQPDGSDLLLRLRILAEHLSESRRNDPNVNKDFVEHIEHMIDRWGVKLNHSVNKWGLVDEINNLNNAELTELLLKEMPERLAYASDYGYDAPVEFVDDAVEERSNNYLRIGNSSRVNGQFLLVLSSFKTPQGDSFISTGHTVPLEIVARILPEKIRVEYGEAHIDRSWAPVKDRKRDRVVKEKEIMIYSPFRARDGQGKGDWFVISSEKIDVGGEGAQDVLEAEKERLSNLELFKQKTEKSIDGPKAALKSILDAVPSGPVRTSAEGRIKELEDIERRLNKDSAGDLSLVQKELDDIVGKIDSGSSLVKKAAKQTGWPQDWFSIFQETTNNIPSVIGGHALLNEVVESGEANRSDVEDKLRAYVFSAGLKDIQNGKKLDLNKAIDSILDDLTSPNS